MLTWQDILVGYIFQQHLELYQVGIQNLEPAPHQLHVSGHIWQGALSLLHHRRRYKAQTCLSPI